MCYSTEYKRVLVLPYPGMDRVGRCSCQKNNITLPVTEDDEKGYESRWPQRPPTLLPACIDRLSHLLPLPWWKYARAARRIHQIATSTTFSPYCVPTTGKVDHMATHLAIPSSALPKLNSP